MIIGYAPIFVRQYKKLPKELQQEAKEKIALFEQDTMHPYLRVHKLKGRFKHYFSFSINYSHRIVFQYKNVSHVEFLLIGDHSVYL